MVDMEALAQRVEALDGPDRTVDCLIALATQGYSLFHSKHNYWTISKGRETVIWEWARHEDWDYDPHTGKRLSEPEEPLDWAWEANLPEWTRSLDDAMTLVPVGLKVGLVQQPDDTWECALLTIEDDDRGIPYVKAATHALVLTAAALRAIGQNENGKTRNEQGKPAA